MPSGTNRWHWIVVYRSLISVISLAFHFFHLYCWFASGNFAKFPKASPWVSFQGQLAMTYTFSTSLQLHWYPWEHWFPSAYVPSLTPALLPCYVVAFKIVIYLAGFALGGWISSAISLKAPWGIAAFVVPSSPIASCCSTSFIALTFWLPSIALSSIFTSHFRGLEYLAWL